MSTATKPMRSGEVAAAAGVNVQTLRYYERRGLLPRPPRTTGGHRGYPSGTVARLRLIKVVQRLGFTLDEIADLLAAGGRRRPGLPERVATKVAEIDARVADLMAARASLVGIVDAGCESVTACRCALASEVGSDPSPGGLRAEAPSSARQDRRDGT